MLLLREQVIVAQKRMRQVKDSPGVPRGYFEEEPMYEMDEVWNCPPLQAILAAACAIQANDVLDILRGAGMHFLSDHRIFDLGAVVQATMLSHVAIEALDRLARATHCGDILSVFKTVSEALKLNANYLCTEDACIHPTWYATKRQKGEYCMLEWSHHHPQDDHQPIA
jgi:hypothetical protein